MGEPFKGCYTQLVIDGFCSPSDAERFCLGMFVSNLAREVTVVHFLSDTIGLKENNHLTGALANVNRNPSVVNARRQIGKRSYLINQESYS